MPDEESPSQYQLDKALRTAVLNGDATAIPDLVEQGANVEVRWKWRESLLMKAAEIGDEPVVTARC